MGIVLLIGDPEKSSGSSVVFIDRFCPSVFCFIHSVGIGNKPVSVFFPVVDQLCWRFCPARGAGRIDENQ